MSTLEIELSPECYKQAVDLLNNSDDDPPRRSRKRSAPRRRPRPRNRYVFYGGRRFKESQRCKVGSIIFPDPAEGWSSLCIRLVEMACDFALELEEQFPIREWGGTVPDLARSDLLIVASNLVDEDEDLPTSQIMQALDEALRWVGYSD